MPYQTLIACEQLARRLADPAWVVVDCRFTLNDPEKGRRDFALSHIPGAVYAHLDEDLSGPIVPGVTGRHPLPPVKSLVGTFSRWGICQGVQVVAYDDLGGAMAARLWWLLRWVGHTDVAVLDGGFPHWQREQRPISREIECRLPGDFRPTLHPELVLDMKQVLARRNDPTWRIVDSRSPERFRGEQEPIDSVAGHISGAVNAPFQGNIGPDGLFNKPECLRARFQQLLGEIAPEQTVFYCGSGVTAAHNVLAHAHAGLGDACLYAGSWSEWITDPNNPIGTG